jgi:hypothetical protein
MKRWLPLVTLLAVVGLAASSIPAHAQSGARLRWNDCDVLATNQNFACDVSTGNHNMVTTVQVGTAVTDFVAVQGHIDLISASAALPDWWKVKNAFNRPGNLCRRTALAAPVTDLGNLPTAVSCANDAWNGNGGSTSGGVDFLWPFPYNATGGPNGTANPAADSLRWARFKFVMAIGPGNNLALNPGTEYFVLALRISNVNTTGATPCAGCADAACLVLNKVEILSTVGGESATLTNDIGSGSASTITWQGGSGANCAAVPVRNTTWGQIKSFYR